VALVSVFLQVGKIKTMPKLVGQSLAYNGSRIYPFYIFTLYVFTLQFLSK